MQDFFLAAWTLITKAPPCNVTVPEARPSHASGHNAASGEEP